MRIQKRFDPIVDREAACYTLVIQSVAANSCSVVPELSRYRCLSRGRYIELAFVVAAHRNSHDLFLLSSLL